MSTQHTPGPWKIDGVRPLPGCLQGAFAIRAGTRPRLALIPRSRSATETDQANARLIAAAPDLLAALKAISVRCDEAADHGHIWADTVIRIGRIVDVAIAEAEEKS